jgi:acetyltransferase-like isoleucine patch superfamily enzyme
MEHKLEFGKSIKGRILYRFSKLIVFISEEFGRWSIPAEDSVIRRRLLKLLGLRLQKPVFLDVGFNFEYGHNIEIGAYTFLRQNAYLGDWERISIGVGTSIARNLSIYTVWHDDRDLTSKGAPITIGNFCFIASGVTILPGVTIGDDCIIGAGSLVTENIAAGSIAFGCPARVISKRHDIPEDVYTGFGYINRATKTPDSRMMSRKQ